MELFGGSYNLNFESKLILAANIEQFNFTGECLFGMARIPGTNQIVLLHHMDDEVRMSLFNLEYSTKIYNKT